MNNIITKINYNWFNKKRIENKIKILNSIIEERLTYVTMDYYDDEVNNSFNVKFNNVYPSLLKNLTENSFFNLHKYISNPYELEWFLISKSFIRDTLKEDLERNLKYENYEEASEIKKLIELNENR